MNKQIGDHLAENGIGLIPFYGSYVFLSIVGMYCIRILMSYRTELGSLVYLIPNPKTMNKSEWDYFRIAPHIDARLIPQEGQPLIYEPVALVRNFVCWRT